MHSRERQSMILPLPIPVVAFLAGLGAALIPFYPIKWGMGAIWNYYINHLQEWKEEVETMLGKREQHEKTRIFSAMIGLSERFIFAASWILGIPEAIAILLALKAAPSFKAWSEHQTIGRAAFNVWFTGNMISIVTAIAIAEVAKFLFIPAGIFVK